MPPKRNKRRKDGDQPDLFYIQRSPAPRKESEAASEPAQMPTAPPSAEPAAAPPLPVVEKIPMTKLAKSVTPEPIEPAPATPEEAIPALTGPEPTNPEMSNPAPLGRIDEPPAEAATVPTLKAKPQRLGVLKHDAPPAKPAAAPRKSGSKKSALIVGVSVMGSRLMGVVREQIFAFMFGSSNVADAFLTAFRIPNLLRDLFA